LLDVLLGAAGTLRPDLLIGLLERGLDGGRVVVGYHVAPLELTGEPVRGALALEGVLVLVAEAVAELDADVLGPARGQVEVLLLPFGIGGSGPPAPAGVPVAVELERERLVDADRREQVPDRVDVALLGLHIDLDRRDDRVYLVGRDR
jgi:hypothetical protein